MSKAEKLRVVGTLFVVPSDAKTIVCARFKFPPAAVLLAYVLHKLNITFCFSHKVDDDDEVVA